MQLRGKHSNAWSMLCASIPVFPPTVDSNGETRYSTIDEHISTQSSMFLYLKSLSHYIDALENHGVYSNISMSSEEIVEVDLDAFGPAGESSTAIAKGLKSQVGNEIAILLETYINMGVADKKAMNWTYEQIMERVLRSKEREKDNITSYLKNMTDEEREIENLFKNNKLERWSKGLQKGLTQYVKETYDEEREELEKQALRERKLGQTSVVTDMNREIYNLDLIAEDSINDDIEKEEYDMSHLPDDDDYGENDDGGMLDYE